jgi:hypothetical protein
MKLHLKKLDQQGFDHTVVLVGFVVFFALIGSWLLYHSLAATTKYSEVHLGSSSGSCLAGTTVADCDSSDNDQAWLSLQGANFRIQNEAGQCLDDWNGSKAYTSLRTNTCYSGDTHQEWNWSGSRLVNKASSYCINADNGDESPGDHLIIYPCNNQNDEQFYETSISTSTGSGEAATLCKDFSYGTTPCDAVGDAVSEVSSGYSSWNSNTQLYCLAELWNQESSWLWYADNPSSGAYGIPQSLPGSKMASAGSDWQTNPKTQIKWGLGYIQSVYGSPCDAWNHEVKYGWYGVTVEPNGTAKHF